MRCVACRFDDTAPTEIYTLSLHDAPPIYWPLALTSMTSNSSSGTGVESPRSGSIRMTPIIFSSDWPLRASRMVERRMRSEEHTSELQSPDHLVCRLLLEKKKTYSSTIAV